MELKQILESLSNIENSLFHLSTHSEKMGVRLHAEDAERLVVEAKREVGKCIRESEGR